MNETSLTFVGLNVLFAALFVAGARAVLGRRGSPILWAFVLVTLLFVYLLPTQEYSIDVGADMLLLSHLLLVAYLMTVMFVARAHTGRMDQLAPRIHEVPNKIIAAAIIGWLAVRAYLIVMYGPAALMFSRAQVFDTDGLVVFSSWGVALSSITTLLLMGVFSVAVIRHAGGGRGQSTVFWLGILAMLALILVTNESPIGSRRLLLVLGALWFSVAWVRSGLPVWVWVLRHSARLAVGAVLVAALAVYYQNVRNNDFTEILAAGAPGELVAATVKFATTLTPEREREEVQHLRSGPFDFFAKVVAVWVMDGRSTDGDAIGVSLAMVVPKALYPGEKPIGDVDDVLLECLHIYPSMPALHIDYPTSLPAIGVADFGPIGVFLLGIVLGLGFVAVGFLMQSVGGNPLAVLIVLGLSVELIGSQEAGLTAILSGLRDSVVALLFILPIGWFWRRISGQIRARKRCEIKIALPAGDASQGIRGRGA
jgi:hypothetical protein